MSALRSIAIVGLGLVGGSLGLRIRHLGLSRVLGVDIDDQVVDRAMERGAVDEGSVEIARIKEAEVIIIAVPLDRTVSVAREAAEHAAEGAILTDVASVKAPIVAQLAGLSRVRYVGGHPMFGTEGRGIAAAAADLPEGLPYVLTPLASTAHDAVNALLVLIQDLGMQPVLLSPDEHDRLVAEVSHLPYLLALLLGGINPAAREIAGPAFRDATRVAASPSDLWLEILRQNRVHVLEALDRFMQGLGEMRAALARGHIQQAVRRR